MSGSSSRKESELHSLEDRRQLGAFYTPASIVEFISQWGIRSADDRILEPAAGAGAFVESIANRLRHFGAAPDRGQVVAVEKELGEAAKIEALVPVAVVLAQDFFQLGPSALPQMSAVLGNPPFIRFQRFSGQPRELGLQRATAQDVELSGLASSWAHFVVHACSFLGNRGRLGLVLPAELLHADYAEPIREYLLRRFASVTIIAFDKRAFHPALVDAVVLLADDVWPAGLHIWRLTDKSQLSQDVLLQSSPWPRESRRWSAGIHQSAAKLYGTLVENPRFGRLGSIASVDIGVVTGANRFFILSEGRRQELGLDPGATRRIVERGRDLHGIAADVGETRWLLDLRGRPRLAEVPTVAAYLAAGVKADVPTGYKCRHRSPWWGVPIPTKPANLLLPYMHHGSPRLISNSEQYLSSNLVHGVHLSTGAPDSRAIAAASLSAAVSFSAEVEGRTYGGGVLKLETSEAERMLMPRLSPEEERELLQLFPDLDALVRTGNREAASKLVDDLLKVRHEECLAAANAFRLRRQGLSKAPQGDVERAEPSPKHPLLPPH
ncbi:MAG: N-6 DNA methylase [Dehalococcoidia bacterium]